MNSRIGKAKIEVKNLTIHFGKVQAIHDVSLDIQPNEILSIIGPANSGKTSFLRSLNRLNDFEPRLRINGSIKLDGLDIRNDIEAEDLRKRVGMIFALPIPLPRSIYDNITYGPRLAGLRDKTTLDRIVEESLKAAYLWDEVKDRLRSSAQKLSGGQQQRLCIARTLALRPEVILFDEPCSGLDPISTAKVEESMLELRKSQTIVLVTNNTKQAARVGTRTAFFLMGELVEIDATEKIFTAPRDPRTNDYIVGRFG
ncbi:MAG: phosphate ABC transporter ATP-binding protein [Candidatus Aminicenantes bacterium]|nr:phosphate ABC transporter ATP-binding protein [Candidatus Aminicenantes bacterium]